MTSGWATRKSLTAGPGTTRQVTGVRVTIEALAGSSSSTETSPKKLPFDSTRRSSSSITTATSPSTIT